ncbi:MAG: DMT family transporter [Lutibacter sp.]|uniref:DMT family transporter n=1 Tax=Lutibacter sp. TaxID=1925666 RepID=UPI0017DBE46A|nr:DMT family transporter [Lutibacter sp.]MBT8316618.1 DMT family transporter [Lutibacter sp.]NNJ57478.1 DMT family transporter [Lutibacter sp.]
MKNNKPLIFGYLFALGATAIWSGNFIIARDLNETIPPISLAFFRWTVAIIALFPFAIKKLITDWYILKKNILYLSIVSFLGVTIFNTLIYIASHTTTAINLSLISITFPVFIVILSRIFFKEKITSNKVIGILLVISGVLLLITNGELSKLLQLSFAIGDIWMLLAAIIFALYSILLRKKPAELSISSFQLSTFMLGLIFMLPFFICETLNTPPVLFESKTVLSILYIGIFASLTAYILWNKAIEKVGATNAGMVYYTLPLFSGFLAYLFLGEAIGINHVFSLLLILSGILIATLKKNN